jgi:hypothetical protein
MTDDEMDILEESLLINYHEEYNNKIEEINKQYPNPKEFDIKIEEFERSFFQKDNGYLLLDYFVKDEENVDFEDFEAKYKCFVEMNNLEDLIFSLKENNNKNLLKVKDTYDKQTIQNNIQECIDKIEDLDYSNETNITAKKDYHKTRLHLFKKLLKMKVTSQPESFLIDKIINPRKQDAFYEAEKIMIDSGDIVQMKWKKGIKELVLYYFYLENLDFFIEKSKIKDRIQFLGVRYSMDKYNLPNSKKHYNNYSKKNITKKDKKLLMAQFRYLGIKEDVKF